MLQAGGVVMRNRVGGQLAISRALGDHALKGDGLVCAPSISCRQVGNLRDKVRKCVCVMACV